MKVIIQRMESFKYVLMNEKETAETFGDDYMKDYGIEISNELMDKYIKCAHEMDAIQKELRELYWGRYNI